MVFIKRLFLILILSIASSENITSIHDKKIIANSYYESELYDDAIIIYEEILENQKTIFGATSQNTLSTLKKLYELQLLNNNTDQGLYYLQEFINIQSSFIIKQQNLYLEPLSSLKTIYTNKKNPDFVFKIDSLINILSNNLDIFIHDTLKTELPYLIINTTDNSETEYSIDDSALEYIELGLTYLKNGLFTESKIHLVNALKLETNILDVKYFDNLDFGIEQDELMNILKEDLVIDSLNTENYFYLGLFNYKNKAYKEAIKYFKEYNYYHNNDINGLLFLGRINELQDDWLDAIFCYHRALQIEVNNFNANLSLAMALMNVSSYNEAINILKYIIKENNDNFNLVYSLGISYYQTQDYNNAIKYLTQSLLLKPNNDQVYYYLGLAYNNINAYKKALDAMKKTISINSSFGLAHYELAKIYQIILNDELAIKHFELAKKEISNDDLNYQLGLLYFKNEMYFKAMQPLKEYIIKNLEDVTTLEILGTTFMNIDRYPEAIDIYLRLIESNNSENSNEEQYKIYLQNIAEAYYQLNDFDNAIKYFIQLLEINNQNYNTLVSIGSILNKQNNFIESERYLTAALNSSYPNKSLLIQLGISYGGQEKFLQSLISFKEALKLSLEDPIIHYQLGIIYKELDIYDLAIKEFLYYLETNKKDDITLLLIGECYMKLKDFNNAIIYLNKSYKINKNIKSLFNIGKCYEQLGDTNNSAKYFKLVIKKDPNHVRSREKLVSIYKNSYRYREAKKECEIIYMLDRAIYNSINYCIE